MNEIATEMFTASRAFAGLLKHSDLPPPRPKCVAFVCELRRPAVHRTPNLLNFKCPRFGWWLNPERCSLSPFRSQVRNDSGSLTSIAACEGKKKRRSIRRTRRKDVQHPSNVSVFVDGQIQALAPLSGPSGSQSTQHSSAALVHKKCSNTTLCPFEHQVSVSITRRMSFCNLSSAMMCACARNVIL